MSDTVKQCTFTFSVSSGLLDHYPVMGESIWLFIALINKQTKGVDKNGHGKVNYGLPIRDQDIADALRSSRRTVMRMRARLLEHNYIMAERTENGFVYAIPKPKKWKEETQQDSAQDVTDVSHPSQCCETQRCDTFDSGCDTFDSTLAQTPRQTGVSESYIQVYKEGSPSLTKDRDDEPTSPMLQCARRVRVLGRRKAKATPNGKRGANCRPPLTNSPA